MAPCSCCVHARPVSPTGLAAAPSWALTGSHAPSSLGDGQKQAWRPTGSALGPLQRVGHEGWGFGQPDPGSPRAGHVLCPPASTGLRGGVAIDAAPPGLGAATSAQAALSFQDKQSYLGPSAQAKAVGAADPGSVIDGGLGAAAPPQDGQPGKWLSAANGPLDKYDRGGWGSFRSGPALQQGPQEPGSSGLAGGAGNRCLKSHRTGLTVSNSSSSGPEGEEGVGAE